MSISRYVKVRQVETTSGDFTVPNTLGAGVAGEGWQADSAGGSGTVSTVSVVSANGLAGTVANPTTEPAITLSTTITGVLKGNGTAISAASQGTDYYAPSGTDVAIADGGTGASTAAGAISNLGITASAAELNILDGATLTVTELNYVDGVTSAIQTQLDAKVDVAGETMSGALIAADHGTASTDEIVNVCYGTGSPPAANTTTEGTIFVQYVA